MKLNLKKSQVNQARGLANKIAGEIYDYCLPYSTDSIERALLRLVGINDANEEGVPYVNIIVERLREENLINDGALYWTAKACSVKKIDPLQLGKLVDANGFSFKELKDIANPKLIDFSIRRFSQSLKAIQKQVSVRQRFIKKWGERETPWLYVIVATGNIYNDLEQAEIAADQGADVIAVIRSTTQSLLDFIPHGATTEGFAGTFATQENFRLMRERLDKVSRRLKRYVRLTNYASGLCMPEMTVLGSLERVDMMLCDAMYGILFRDINMRRNLIDQFFSRRLLGYANIIINTGEDNYLTTDEQLTAAHQVLSSQFINEQLALKAKMPENLMGLGHAFEMNPNVENGLLLSIADALLTRECFPSHPIKYMPPTKHITGDIFFAHVMNTLFNVTSAATAQHIHLVGVLSEAIHTPYIHERMQAIENVRYVLNYAKNFQQEFTLTGDGIINQRARQTIDGSIEFLKTICEIGLMKAIEKGLFAGMRRKINQGKGADGVFQKSDNYLNPLENLI